MTTTNLKQQAINDRIYSRNIPANLLEPAFTFRPINTKYVHLQDIPPLHTTNLNSSTNKYDDNEIFNPGDRAGPWIGFSSNVDVESILRDQLRRTNCQSNYRPNYKSSDLYNVNILPNINNLNIQEFPYLFSTIPKCSSNPEVPMTSSTPIPKVMSYNNTNTFNTCSRLNR
jgi:hypothetical protein